MELQYCAKIPFTGGDTLNTLLVSLFARFFLSAKRANSFLFVRSEFFHEFGLTRQVNFLFGCRHLVLFKAISCPEVGWL